MTEDEMVEWHHQLNGPEFEQTPGDSEDRGAKLQEIVRTEEPGVLQSMRSQKVGHSLTAEQHG